MDAAGNPTSIPVSCVDIWEGAVDAKVAMSDEAWREESLRTVQFLREEACPDQIEEEARFRDNTRQTFVLPDSLSNGLAVAHSIGVILIMILASSVLGTEYGWGTLRKVYFDLSTSSPGLIRRIHSIFADRGIPVLDAPVSGGPRGARSGKLAIWVGGDEDVYLRYKPVLDAIGDQAYYVGPIGSGSIAKLVHNCAGYIVQCDLAEVFTMGVKAGVEPLALWQAVRRGALGRRGTFEGMPEHLLPGKFDPPDFALRFARKDVDLAVGVGREYDVLM